MAVLPKPMLPTTTTPRLVEGSLLRRQPSTSWKSHSLPVKSQSEERPGISKWRGFRLREGVKETVGRWKHRFAIMFLTEISATRWLHRVRTSVVLLAAAARVLPGHSERSPGGNVPLLLIQVG